MSKISQKAELIDSKVWTTSAFYPTEKSELKRRIKAKQKSSMRYCFEVRAPPIPI